MSKKNDFITELGESIMDEQDSLNENNEVGEAYVKKAYTQIKTLLERESVSVTLKLHEPFKGTGCITIIGKEVVIEHPEEWAAICAGANNVDIYPKLDGTIQIDLSYHGLMNKDCSEVR